MKALSNGESFYTQEFESTSDSKRIRNETLEVDLNLDSNNSNRSKTNNKKRHEGRRLGLGGRNNEDSIISGPQMTEYDQHPIIAAALVEGNEDEMRPLPNVHPGGPSPSMPSNVKVIFHLRRVEVAAVI